MYNSAWKNIFNNFKAKSITFCVVLMFLSGCSTCPNYQRNEHLKPDEAVLVYRYINTGYEDRLSKPYYLLEITGLCNECNFPSGNIDDANSSLVRVVKVKAGNYKIKSVKSNAGNVTFVYDFNIPFKAEGGEVFYIGDIIFSAESESLIFFDNFPIVKEKLRREFPELVSKVKDKTAVLQFTVYLLNKKEKKLN